jgi:malonyl CoA-acyl carrier protein transacylase
MGARAILFPGQGSQRDDMGAEALALAPDLHELTLREVGEDPFARAGESTRFAQPAILCAALARWIGAGRPSADAFAGHSLGELGAAAAAGALSEESAIRLAAERGRLMSAAAEAEPGGMLALLCGADEASAIAAASRTVVANDNAPAQVVLSGGHAEIDAAAAEAKACDVRSIRLDVGGAFHSPAMRPALAPFGELLSAAEVMTPGGTLISSVTLAPLETAGEVRAALTRAIVEPVRWRECVELLGRRGVDSFEETGPGKALSGMVRRTLDGVSATPLTVREPVAGGARG